MSACCATQATNNIMKRRPSANRTPRLGQHFLVGTWAAAKLAEAVVVRPGRAGDGETILEIGPGKGALTRELLRTGARVVAVEKDAELVRLLQATFAEEIASGQLRIIAEDIRNVDATKLGLSHYVLAANIPYYITGEILRQFLETAVQPRALALLVQKEVAERILARNGKESILSLSVKAYGRPSIVAKVARGNFSPPPSVDSAILLIDDVSKDFFAAISEQDFFSIVRAGFSSKRKFVASNLSSLYSKDAVLRSLSACGIDEKTRAEDIPLERWERVVETLTGPVSGIPS